VDSSGVRFHGVNQGRNVRCSWRHAAVEDPQVGGILEARLPRPARLRLVYPPTAQATTCSARHSTLIGVQEAVVPNAGPSFFAWAATSAGSSTPGHGFGVRVERVVRGSFSRSSLAAELEMEPLRCDHLEEPAELFALLGR